MAVPRVFISSTYYDMRHVRNAVKDFIESLGFEPVLSEQFNVFYQHGKSAQKSCLDEINKCDMYILIIGTQYDESMLFHVIEDSIPHIPSHSM